MPESRKRKPARASRPATGAAVTRKKGPSPRWLPALMVVLFGIGMLWLVVFYLTEARMGGLPYASDIGNWNLLVGFGFIIAGFVLATQWR